jgi:hypothetical protein
MSCTRPSIRRLATAGQGKGWLGWMGWVATLIPAATHPTHGHGAQPCLALPGTAAAMRLSLRAAPAEKLLPQRHPDPVCERPTGFWRGGRKRNRQRSKRDVCSRRALAVVPRHDTGPRLTIALTVPDCVLTRGFFHRPDR